MNRRDFLRGAAVGVAAGLAGSIRKASALDQKAAEARSDKVVRQERARRLATPGEKLRVGFIGAGGRAQHVMVHERLADHGTIVAVCDCFLPRAEQAAKKLPSPDKIAVYQDYRKMLEKEKLDAVFVPTTTHARALICIQAMQAGLDVYAEKPVSLTIAEGRALVRAARHYKRILQVGTQQRSIPVNVFGSKLVRDGAIGKIKEVIACNFTGPAAWKPQPGQPVPAGLDWELWTNQTELRPYHPDLQHKWALWRDYDGGGQSWGVTGWGTHALDQVQCALGTDKTGPVEIWPVGIGPECKVMMRYASGTVLKLEGKPRQPGHEDLGAIFIGEKGKIEIIRGHCIADPPDLLKGAPPDTAEGPGEAVDHLRNFFECMRSRKLPNADIETAHRATTVCHLVNICRQLGRKLHWDPKAEEFLSDDEANRLVSRPRRKGYELPKEFTKPPLFRI